MEIKKSGTLKLLKTKKRGTLIEYQEEVPSLEIKKRYPHWWSRICTHIGGQEEIEEEVPSLETKERGTLNGDHEEVS